MLGVEDNGLRELPTELGQLTSMRFLALTGNELTSLPTELGQLSELRGMQVDEGVQLPTQLGRLVSAGSLKVDVGDPSEPPLDRPPPPQHVRITSKQKAPANQPAASLAQKPAQKRRWRSAGGRRVAALARRASSPPGPGTHKS